MTEIVRLNVAGEKGRGLTATLLESLLERIGHAADARAFVLEGSGDVFCRGLDLEQVRQGAKDVGPAAVEGTLGLLQELLGGLRTADRPVVAVVDGDAMGGGVGLAAAADIVIASPRATFSLPETLFGLIPGVIFPYLADRVGGGRARAMAFMGERVDATRASEWGLVDVVSVRVKEAEDTILRRLLRQDAAAQSELKRLLATHDIHSGSWPEAAIATFSELLSGAQARARIARFTEGRKPWETETDS